MQRYDDNLLARSGAGGVQPMSGVSVTVTDDATGQRASLYSGNGTGPLANPVTTDDNGSFGFYAPDGSYTLTFAGPRIATFTRKLILDDPKDTPYATLAQLAAPSAAGIIGYTRATDGAVMTMQNALDSATYQNDTTVRGAILTGLSTVTNAPIAATDSVLGAFGKLQAQFNQQFRNVANTFTSYFTNTNTASRTYTLPDKNGTVALTSDLPPAGFSNLVVLTSAQPWTPPAGVAYAEITVINGGSSSATSTTVAANGGNGGAAGVSIIAVNPAVTYTVAPGSGGGAPAAGTDLAGNAGGASSFSGSGITTLTTSNAALKIAFGPALSFGAATSQKYGGGSIYAPVTLAGVAPGIGAGGGPVAASVAGQAGGTGAIIIRY